ncbi:hypothetical protein HanIR_Chr05g0233651 [Helianthus annuus]|nr:hypothetical protein HanIR_Chr05g0233651 [Helianthus annuus]
MKTLVIAKTQKITKMSKKHTNFFLHTNFRYFRYIKNSKKKIVHMCMCTAYVNYYICALQIFFLKKRFFYI